MQFRSASDLEMPVMMMRTSRASMTVATWEGTRFFFPSRRGRPGGGGATHPDGEGLGRDL